MVRELDWHGCYRDNLTGKIHPDAFAHPAKMAWGLAKRIFEHLFDRGWLKKGHLAADPFGGIGVTGLVAASFGCPCILVELEQKFVDLANKSFELHYDAWDKMGKPRPIILQGDSRNFSSIIREAVDSIVTSPPFQQALKGGGIMKDGYASPQRPDLPPDWIAERTYAEGQIGTTEGQIGAVKEGKLDEVVAGIITSPAYAESLQPETEEQTRRKQERIAKAKTIHNGRALEKPSPGKAALGGGYGVSKGQLGAMKEGDFEGVVNGVITSPAYPEVISTGERRDIQKAIDAEEGYLKAHPELKGKRPKLRLYGDSKGQIGHLREGDFEEVKAVVTSAPYGHDTVPHRAEPMEEWRGTEKWAGPHSVVRAQGYGANPDNLGNLPEGDYEAVVNGIVTSGPYEASLDRSKNAGRAENLKRRALKMKYGGLASYSENSEQIGNFRGDTYWTAVTQVYRECWKALKPDGIMVVVVKDFVRDKKRVPLCDQTFELLKAIGFKPLERIRAWLVQSEYPTTLLSEEEEYYLYEVHERERRAKYEARVVKAKAEGRRSSSYRPHTFEGWLTAWRQKKTASFFRRDTEKKGSPRIDWEEVLICQKVG